MHPNLLQERIPRAARPALLILIAALAGCGKPVALPKPPEGAPSPQEAQRAKEKKAVAQPLFKPPDTRPEIEIVEHGVTLRWIEKGKTSMDAKARKFEGDEVTRKGVLVDFSARLYDNGKLTTTVTAPKVVVDGAERIVTATGGVKLVSLDRGTVVNSKWIKWYSRENRIVGNGGVKTVTNTAAGDRYEMKGAAFETDTALKTLKILNSPKGLDYK